MFYPRVKYLMVSFSSLMALGKDERKEKIFGVLYPGGLGLLGTYFLTWYFVGHPIS